MASPYQIRELQRATNGWTQHHCKDILGRIRVDSVLGPSTRTTVLRAFFYMGGGLPSIKKWWGGIPDSAVADLTDWFRHPLHFLGTHKAAAKIGENRLKAARRVKVVDGLAEFDGARVAPWLQPWLVYAKGKGWEGGIPDKVYGGFRTYAQQKWLYDHDPPPVASPDLPSNHQLKDFDGGAVDCSFYDELDQILSAANAELGRQGDAPSSDPVHFSSRTRFNRTGHY